MHDQQSFSDAVAAEIRKHFGDLVFAQVIPRDVTLAAAPSHGHTIIDHAPLSEGSLAYLSLARELIQRLVPEKSPHDGKQSW